MTQYNLPERYRENWHAFLPSIDYQSIYWNADRSFVISMIISYIVLYINLRIRRAKNNFYMEKDD